MSRDVSNLDTGDGSVYDHSAVGNRSEIALGWGNR